MNYQID